MPEMDGIETLRQIRAKKGAGVSLPVIAMSADSSGQVLGEHAGPRFDGYIDKPLCVETLARVLLPLAPLREGQRPAIRDRDAWGEA
jgi:CheY-like chemotaxis protein